MIVHTRIILTFFIILSGILRVPAQDSLNMNLLYNWDDSSVYVSYYWDNMPQQYNEIWGYYDEQTQREYAIIGTALGTHVFDVTDGDKISKADFRPGKDTAEIHRDFKTYKNYLIGVADEGAASIQVFDLSTLPDSMTLVYDSNEFAVTAHNCFVEGDRLYLCGVITDNSISVALRVLDISDPINPVFLTDITMAGQGYYTHDIYVRGDTAYCSNLTDGLFIYDLTDINNPTLLASITSYEDQGVNHSSWLSEDGKTLFFVDETPDMGIKAFDVSDLNNIESISLFRSNPGAMPHNIFVHGDYLYVSYYHDGVWIFDVSDPLSPEVAAYYDTYVEKDGYKSFQGCWGVYPYLPSGKILASDFANGLFVLEADLPQTNTGVEVKVDQSMIKVYPTNAQNVLMVQLPSEVNRKGTLVIRDLKGAQVLERPLRGESVMAVDVHGMPPGMYFVEWKAPEMFYRTKFIKK